MPIKIPGELPAKEVLENENIFVMEYDRATTQDIRPLNIIILNLMPEKIKTETQLLRYLSNTPLQVNITFLRMTSHQSKNTSALHLDRFYKSFADIKDFKFDGMIITGSPVERLSFREVDYWDELKMIMDWSQENVTSNLHICWGAQAALFHHYGVDKYEMPEKLVGVFEHQVLLPKENLVRGFNDTFVAPHSRYTDIEYKKVKEHPELQVLAESDKAGIFLLGSKDGKNLFMTGHLEYSAMTLAEEYERDHERGINTPLPENYFPGDDPKQKPVHHWRSHASLLYSNWLNYYVYQTTPFEWN